MKRKLFLFALLLAALPLRIMAQIIRYDFSAASPSGHTLYYLIANDGEVQVVAPEFREEWFYITSVS